MELRSRAAKSELVSEVAGDGSDSDSDSDSDNKDS